MAFARDLLRGSLDLMVLSDLGGGSRYGYQILASLRQQSEGRIDLKAGTLYPILHKLEKEQLIRGAWSDEGPRRKRKSYSLTAKGRRYHADQVANWERFFDRFSSIVGGKKQ